MPWFVYVLVSESARLTYVGITQDIDRRTRQHNGLLHGGARSTRRARPWKTAAVFGPYASRGTAQRVESEVKRLRGRDRLAWREGGGAPGRKTTRSRKPVS